MKEKFARMVALAIVSIVSAALVAYLKDPNNRLAVKRFMNRRNVIVIR